MSGCLMALASILLALGMTGPFGMSPLPSRADPQDGSAVEADFAELETAVRVQDWDQTSSLAAKTLRDFRAFMKATRVRELTDVEKDLSGALAHLRDLRESASATTEAEAERDWKDLDREYRRLQDGAKQGSEAVNLSAANAAMGSLKNAVEGKDWTKARSSAAEAEKALRAAYPPAVLDPTREKLGACETHLEDVQAAAGKRIVSEVSNDTRRAKADWESVRGQMVK